MKGRSTALILFLLVATPRAALAVDRAELGAQKGVLLLTNGEVIAGEITPAGDRYDVIRGGSELRVKVSDVQVIADDILACYRFQNERLSDNNAAGHLDLADWCLRQTLFDPARRELEVVRAIDPRNPRIHGLETRLEIACRPPTPATPRVGPPQPSAAELDQMVRGMPDGAVETFTSTIQPILINRCSTAGCHGATTTGGLRLLRVVSQQASSRRATQRNLLSTLAVIDRDNPGDSALLTKPIGAHGTAKAPIFTSRDVAQFKLLSAWVHRVAGRKSPASDLPASVDEPPSSALLQTIDKPRKSTKRRDEQAPEPTAEGGAGRAREFGEPYAPEDETPRDDGESAGAVFKFRSGPQRGAAREEFTPRDAFDPEIFNRRYAPAPSGREAPTETPRTTTR